MNIFKKTIIIASIIVILFMVFIIVVLWSVRGDIFFIGYNKFFIAPSCKKVDSFLTNNINELSYVAKELSQMNYDRITIQYIPNREEAEYTMTVNRNFQGYETIPIPKELADDIKLLFEDGIRRISYGGDSVNFTLWSTMDESRGIIYSYTGTEPNGEQLIEVSELSKLGWYYYVNNYEKAIEQYPERFK